MATDSICCVEVVNVNNTVNDTFSAAVFSFASKTVKPKIVKPGVDFVKSLK